MSDSIRKLIDYLADNGYDRAISLKPLSQPTGKDFNNIATFLMIKTDPNFKSTGNNIKIILK